MLDDNARVLDYWRRRAELDKGEWTAFYGLVFPLLMRTRLPAEFHDQAARSALVNSFFADKILLNAATSNAGPLVHMHALHRYLQKYALGMLREQSKFIPLDEPEAPGDETGDGGIAHARHEQLLEEAGIIAYQARSSADRFLASLVPGELAYLRYHTCAGDDAPAEPVKAIAERFAMGSSYHYKAQRLGITLSKGETYRGYAATKIGQWLLDVGARLDTEWREEIAALLLLLCQRARSRQAEPA